MSFCLVSQYEIQLNPCIVDIPLVAHLSLLDTFSPSVNVATRVGVDFTHFQSCKLQLVIPSIGSDCPAKPAEKAVKNFNLKIARPGLLSNSIQDFLETLEMQDKLANLRPTFDGMMSTVDKNIKK